MAFELFVIKQLFLLRRQKKRRTTIFVSFVVHIYQRKSLVFVRCRSAPVLPSITLHRLTPPWHCWSVGRHIVVFVVVLHLPSALLPITRGRCVVAQFFFLQKIQQLQRRQIVNDCGGEGKVRTKQVKYCKKIEKTTHKNLTKIKRKTAETRQTEFQQLSAQKTATIYAA